MAAPTYTYGARSNLITNQWLVASGGWAGAWVELRNSIEGHVTVMCHPNPGAVSAFRGLRVRVFPTYGDLYMPSIPTVPQYVMDLPCATPNIPESKTIVVRNGFWYMDLQNLDAAYPVGVEAVLATVTAIA